MGKERVEKIVSGTDAYDRLSRLCSTHEMCTFQAVQKMYRWGVVKEEQAKILERLTEERYIDDCRYAIAFARDKSRFDKWGPQKIKSYLTVKQIKSEYIRLALEEIVADELPDAVIRELERKSGTIKHSSLYDLRMKLIAFGVRKGYDFNVVAKAVNRMVEET